MKPPVPQIVNIDVSFEFLASALKLPVGCLVVSTRETDTGLRVKVMDTNGDITVGQDECCIQTAEGTWVTIKNKGSTRGATTDDESIEDPIYI